MKSKYQLENGTRLYTFNTPTRFRYMISNHIMVLKTRPCQAQCISSTHGKYESHIWLNLPQISKNYEYDFIPMVLVFILAHEHLHSAINRVVCEDQIYHDNYDFEYPLNKMGFPQTADLDEIQSNLGAV